MKPTNRDLQVSIKAVLRIDLALVLVIGMKPKDQADKDGCRVLGACM